ncbi:MAG: hypothetical protein ACJ703_09380, partial [Nitrososphaera sp.]
IYRIMSSEPGSVHLISISPFRIYLIKEIIFILKPIDSSILSGFWSTFIFTSPQIATGQIKN